MALRYVTLVEIKAYAGITGSGNDTLLTMLWESAELYFDQLIGSPTGLIASAKTEVHDPKDYGGPETGHVFYLKTYRPTAITTIAGLSPGTINVDYTLAGRKLTMKTGVSMPSAFPYTWTIVYTSGYTAIADIPADVKTAVLSLVKAAWVQRQAMGISSFKQDLLSVTYDKGFLEGMTDQTAKWSVQAAIHKYLIPHVYAT